MQLDLRLQIIRTEVLVEKRLVSGILMRGSGAVAINNGGGGGSHGTITGATWIITGPNNKPALAFASGRSVSLGSVTTNVNVTVTAWIQTSNAGQQPAFSNRGSGLYLGTTGGKFFTFYNNSSSQSMVSVATVNDNKWHHVAWTSDGITQRMYVDGKIDSSSAQTRSSADTGAGYIGYDAPNGEYFAGNIAQVGVYTQTLSQNDIQRQYAAGLDPVTLALGK